MPAPAAPNALVPLGSLTGAPPAASRHTLLGGVLALPAGTLLAGAAADHGCPLVVVDGANSFDPYLVAKYARRLGKPPAAILDRENFLLSRAFTCHQLTAVLEERVLPFLERAPSVLLVAGPLATFMDESVPAREVGTLFRRTMRALERLRERATLLVSQPPLRGARGRHGFLPALAGLAETVALVERCAATGRIRFVRPDPRVVRPAPGAGLPLIAGAENDPTGRRGVHG